MTLRSNRPLRGFTLVELLVVITIIGVLAGFVLVAVQRVVPQVQDNAVKIELRNIEQSIQLYKENHGSYFPDLNAIATTPSRADAMNRHLKRLFNRRNPTTDVFDPTTATGQDHIRTIADESNLINKAHATTTGAYSFDTLDPSEVWVLFLMGFSPDVERPITGPGTRQALYEFDEKRLVDEDDDGWWAYKPDYNEAEIVYFNAKTYATFPDPDAYGWDGSGSVAELDFNAVGSLAEGVARPYLTFDADGDIRWVNDSSFQLMVAGRDADFGEYDTSDPDFVKLYPDGFTNTAIANGKSQAYTNEDRDNITNFAQGANLAADESLNE